MDEQQVLKQRLRAERRKKILSNAKSRMEKLRNVQQWSEQAEQGVECEAEENEERDGRRCEGEERGSIGKQSEQSLAEDPPDELLPPLTHRAPITTCSPSTSFPWVGAWVATLHNMLGLRALFTALTAAVGACATVVFGYSIPCFLCLLTSELCILLWTLINAVMSREVPPTKNSHVGTVGVLKLALAVVYPPASRLLDHVHQSLLLCGVVLQDLCVGLFSFISVTVLCHLIQTNH